MKKLPLSVEDVEKCQRWFAVESNNLVYAIADQPERTSENVERMIDAAHAARMHWREVGTTANEVRACLTLAHAYSAAGLGDRAAHYAGLASSLSPGADLADWDFAFLALERAWAAAVMGDGDDHRTFYHEAEKLGAEIADAEDREIFFAELAKIPGV